MDIRVEDDKPESARNVLGEPMDLCCEKPLTGFYRNGRCDTGPDDHGVHTVCIRASSEFLEYSSSVGNDLSTPMTEFGFPGLQEGDRWVAVFPCLPTPKDFESECWEFESLRPHQSYQRFTALFKIYPTAFVPFSFHYETKFHKIIQI